MKIGRIDFLNTLPFFHGLKDRLGTDGFQWADGMPVEINEKLLRGEIDAAIASSFLLTQDADAFYVLPGMGISADGPSRSVFLYSAVPLEKLHGQTIAVTHKSLSAAHLLKILLRKRFALHCGFESTVLQGADLRARWPAGLVIGDEALFWPRESKYIYDLSALWQEWTGTPFCFALWLVRKDFADQNPEQTGAFYRALRESLAVNLGTLAERIAGAYPAFSAAQKELAREYLGHLEYAFSPASEQGLNLYFAYARELGFIQENPRWHYWPANEKILAG